MVTVENSISSLFQDCTEDDQEEERQDEGEEKNWFDVAAPVSSDWRVLDFEESVEWEGVSLVVERTEDREI